MANRLHANSCQTGGLCCLLQTATRPAFLFLCTFKYTRYVPIFTSVFPFNFNTTALLCRAPMDDDEVNAPWVLRERLVPSFQSNLRSCNARELQEQCSCLLVGLACNEP